MIIIFERGKYMEYISLEDLFNHERKRERGKYVYVTSSNKIKPNKLNRMDVERI